MKTIYITLILIATFEMGFWTNQWLNKTKLSESIELKTLEERVFAQYGGGDAGVEEMLYLKTGIHQDFMGNPE